ncbi:MAG: UDP-2,3-diacylglucosamine diphosphatase LpxI [Rhodobacteraceae bacterium]|nr:UDP-2,3-diacylglucosamine diphosphatase LpxI [Paracoccaceae bacterium]
MGALAIVAGQGELPRLLAEHCRETGRSYLPIRFRRMEMDWFADHPGFEAEFERFGALFAAMRDAGCDEVVFAGAMSRPNPDPRLFDDHTRAIAPRLIQILAQGDDATLRAVADLFESEGFHVIAAQDVLADLLAGAGALGAVQPSKADLADIARAAEIADALGRVDVAQGAVVAQGICLGVESIQGTDAMLDFVATRSDGLRPDANGARGVLWKGPKPGQDSRMDTPAIGPVTVEGAARAGLAGIAVAKGGVLVLDRARAIALADRLGLFVYGAEQ